MEGGDDSSSEGWEGGVMTVRDGGRGDDSGCEGWGGGSEGWGKG